MLRGSVRAPLGFSSGKPSAEKPQGLRPLGFSASGLPLEAPSGALTLPLSTVLALTTLSLGDSSSTLPLGFSRVSKNLPRGPRAEGQVFTDPPSFCWQVHHSCSSNRMLEQIPAVAAAVAAESFTTEQVCKILSTVRDRNKMED